VRYQGTSDEADDENPRRLPQLLVLLGSWVAWSRWPGLWAAHTMEDHGHVITGMNNQIVWGLPHVFAIFMIVAASGVLNVASIGSVFGQPCTSRARRCRACCASPAGRRPDGADARPGRPDRVIVAATHYNFKSVFAWNVFLYSGMVGLVAVYLWTMFERRFNTWSKAGRPRVLAWRFVLTTGTGLDLRLPGGAPGLPVALLAAAVHRAVVSAGGWPCS
jgi:molybdopterin-containing oxidoreductase family membrane subunit